MIQKNNNDKGQSTENSENAENAEKDQDDTFMQPGYRIRWVKVMGDLTEVAQFRPRATYLYNLMDTVIFQDFETALDGKIEDYYTANENEREYRGFFLEEMPEEMRKKALEEAQEEAQELEEGEDSED